MILFVVCSVVSWIIIDCISLLCYGLVLMMLIILVCGRYIVSGVFGILVVGGVILGGVFIFICLVMSFVLICRCKKLILLGECFYSWFNCLVVILVVLVLDGNVFCN